MIRLVMNTGNCEKEELGGLEGRIESPFQLEAPLDVHLTGVQTARHHTCLTGAVVPGDP